MLCVSFAAIAQVISVQLSIGFFFLFSFLQANVKVLIVHCKTNQALAVLGDQVLWYLPFSF